MTQQVDAHCQDCERLTVAIWLGHWVCAICGSLFVAIRRAA